MPYKYGNTKNKLSTDQVRAIRESSESQTALAKEFGISQSQVSRILNGRVWMDQAK